MTTLQTEAQTTSNETTKVRRSLFVTTSFPRHLNDHSGPFVFRMAKYLARSGIETKVLAPGAPGYPRHETLEDVAIDRYPYFYPRKLQKLAYGDGGGIVGNLKRYWLARIQVPCYMLATVRAILRHQDEYDVIHCHWLPTALAALIARPLSRKKPPIILTNWGSDTRDLPKPLVRWVVSRVDGCISSALETDEHLRAVGRTDFAHVGVPADEERFDRDKVLEDLREETNLPNDVPVVCFVARLVDIKDPLTFLRAAKVLQDRGTRFHFVLAGDGDLGDDCRKLIAEEGVGDHVTMIGMRTDTERVFRISDVSVHVSPTENTWSTSIAEAMQMDVPVVLTDAGYTTGVFSHEKDCLIIPVGDHVALADSIARLLGDRELTSRLTSGAWDLMRAYKKDSVSMSRAIRDYYEKVAEDRAEKRR